MNLKKPPFQKSVFFAFSGLWKMLKTERNFQIEVVALLINIFLIVYLKVEKIDCIVLLLVSFLVLIVETLNTSIEKICDYVQPNFHKSIGLIKDLSAGAVLLSAILSVIIALIIYPKYIL